MSDDSIEIERLQARCGGYWGRHPKHVVADWQYLVSNGDTRQGYWEWVLHKIHDDGGE